MFDFNLLSVIASIIFILAIGYFVKRIGLVEQEHSSVLNNIIINITLPAFIFRAIYETNLSLKLFYIPVIAFSTTLIMVLLAYLVGKVFKLDKQLQGTFMLASAVGNTGYIAYPLLAQYLGNAALVRGILYDMFGTVVFMLTVGLAICSFYGKDSDKNSNIKQFFLFPPLYALILGFALHSIVIPEFFMNTIDIVANVTLGLILLSIGIALEPGRGLRRYFPLIGAALVLKLFLAPIIVFGLANIFKLDSLSVASTTIDASMPTALLTLVFGIKYRLNIDYLSSTIFVLTIASVVTVPLVQLVLGR